MISDKVYKGLIKCVDSGDNSYVVIVINTCVELNVIRRSLDVISYKFIVIFVYKSLNIVYLCDALLEVDRRPRVKGKEKSVREQL